MEGVECETLVDGGPAVVRHEPDSADEAAEEGIPSVGRVGSLPGKFLTPPIQPTHLAAAAMIRLSRADSSLCGRIP
jgi:hypothetical protein